MHSGNPSYGRRRSVMPGHLLFYQLSNYGIHVEDRDIVAAIVAGNPAGLAQAYDRYSAPLFTYCRTLLRESADAADAVQDTFVIASAKLSGLRDPDKLRTWLYAVARNECYRRLRSREIAPGLDEVPDMRDESAEVGADAERAELQYLVHDALTGLNPGEREVIELNLRHDYDSNELADALGVSRNHAHAMLSRARNQLKTSLGALLVARTGRHACVELDDMLGSWDGQMSILLRKRINRHIDSCETCGERRRRELTPAALFGILPLAALPPGFRDRVLRLCADGSPQAVQYRAKVTQQAGSFTAAGFPAGAAIALSGRWRAVRRNALLATPAAVVMVAACVIFAALAVTGSPTANLLSIGPQATGPLGSGSPAQVVSSSAAPASPGPSVSRKAQLAGGASASPGPASAISSATSAAPTSAAPTPAHSASKAAKPTHSAKPSSAPSSTAATASPSPTPSPTPSATPTTGTLQVSASTVTLTIGANGGEPQGTFTLTAENGPVSLYWLTIGDSADGALTVSPSSGTLPEGQTVTITLSLTTRESLDTQVLIEPGDASITVLYTAPVDS
jgi:RNA polymerase sigma factor (sigma-70 family)